MEIQSLALLITEDDVNAQLARHLPRDLTIEGLRVRLTPEGVAVSGTYPALFLNVAFESVWVPRAINGQVVVRLESLSVAGIPAGNFKRLILGMVEDLLKNRPGFSVADDAVRVDVEELLRHEGVPLTLNLRAIRCGAGFLRVEAGV
jgi:hypothetical protein